MAMVVVPCSFRQLAIECKSLVKQPNTRISNCSGLIGYATIISVSDTSIPAAVGLITVNCEILFTFSFFVLLIVFNLSVCKIASCLLVVGILTLLNGIQLPIGTLKTIQNQTRH